MKITFKIIKWVGSLVLLFLIYLIGCIIYGTATDFQPPERTPLKIQSNFAKNVQDTITNAKLSLLNWNIGYGGLGGQSDFFYDGGHFFFSGDKMVRSPEHLVEEYVAGITSFVEQNPADFVLLQEVDRGSKRSYYTNEYEKIDAVLPNHNSTFAANFVVERVPIPICEPWNVMGEMNSGLATYAKYRPTASVRYQFPGEYGWPNRIFHLDRCMSVQRFSTSHPDGKELVVINTHNSAYDGGKLKKQEMDYFKSYVLKEYEKGNYIIVGGDWNQSPPNIPFDKVAQDYGVPTDSKYNSGNIAADFLPEGWQWVYDSSTPTNRKVTEKLDYGKTFMVLIDYYLLSPNIRPLTVKGKNLKFAYSDHNPVYMEVELLGLPSPTLIDSVVVDSTKNIEY